MCICIRNKEKGGRVDRSDPRFYFLFPLFLLVSMSILSPPPVGVELKIFHFLSSRPIFIFTKEISFLRTHPALRAIER